MLLLRRDLQGLLGASILRVKCLVLVPMDGNHNWNLPPIHSQSKKGFGANTTFVIHPDTLLDVFYMERRNRQVISGRHELKYELACENMPAKDGIMIIDEP